MSSYAALKVLRHPWAEAALSWLGTPYEDLDSLQLIARVTGLTIPAPKLHTFFDFEAYVRAPLRLSRVSSAQVRSGDIVRLSNSCFGIAVSSFSQVTSTQGRGVHVNSLMHRQLNQPVFRASVDLQC